MEILNGLEEAYAEHRKVNEDESGYGQYIFDFANQWADLMEMELDRIDKWKCKAGFLQHNAEELAKKTHNYDGLSGYQYDCAIHTLVSYWKYGFELWFGLCLAEYYDGTDDFYENIRNPVLSEMMKLYIDKKYDAILKYKESVQENIQTDTIRKMMN